MPLAEPPLPPDAHAEQSIQFVHERRELEPNRGENANEGMLRDVRSGNSLGLLDVSRETKHEIRIAFWNPGGEGPELRRCVA